VERALAATPRALRKVLNGLNERVWQIGIVGTFDVENYGDLLFPLIAEAELIERLGRVELHRFSYHARSAPEWPYDVISVADLPSMIDRLDALLIGGGFLIRFDKYVADDYLPPSPQIHHPTGYWLTPALTALTAGVPVAWNAPGMHCNDIPTWAGPLLELALGGSGYIAVRDHLSKAALSPFVDGDRIEVVPDSGFGLARLLPEGESEAMRGLRERAALNKPYLIVQPVRWRDGDFPAFLTRHAELLADYQLLALPMGPVLRESNEMLGEEASRFVQLPFWPEPALIAELVRGASAVIGHSYHLAITALVFGVPVFTSVDLDAGKFTALRAFETVRRLESIDDPGVFLRNLGRKEPTAPVLATLPRLAAHWDAIAEMVRGGRRSMPAELGRFWQQLPALLEPPPEPVELPQVPAVSRTRRFAHRLVSRMTRVVRRKEQP
jgi:lipopolysaccharide transport system ATP-binding protein